MKLIILCLVLSSCSSMVLVKDSSCYKVVEGISKCEQLK